MRTRQVLLVSLLSMLSACVKDDGWRCDRSVADGTYTQLVMVGKAMIPQTRTRYKCVLWSRPVQEGVQVSNGSHYLVVAPDLTVAP